MGERNTMAAVFTDHLTQKSTPLSRFLGGVGQMCNGGCVKVLKVSIMMVPSLRGFDSLDLGLASLKSHCLLVFLL